MLYQLSYASTAQTNKEYQKRQRHCKQDSTPESTLSASPVEIAKYGSPRQVLGVPLRFQDSFTV